MAVNERFLWAANILQIQPQDRVLEIGCGAGLLVEQIASRLKTGSVTAVDRSAAMIKMALKKNADPVSTGNARLLHLGFTDSSFRKSEFDKIAAFNVNFFWRNPAVELGIINKILKPGGTLFIFYQAPFEITPTAADPIKNNLKKHSFKITDTIFQRMKPTPVFCVKAQPGG